MAETALGLLGGTFDPIHHGHLRLAEEACEALELAAVRLIPAGQPPHRDQPLSTPAQRLQMVRLATAGNPRLEIDDAEVRSPQASYTVLTLERLRRELGATRPLVLILGADAFAGLANWHRWEALFALCHLAVATRPGYALQADGLPFTPSTALQAQITRRRTDEAAALHQQAAGLILPFSVSALDISATAIRHRLARGASVRYLLPDSVVDYIDAQQLYAASPP